MPGVTGVLGNDAYKLTEQRREINNALGKDQFLQLLVAQMQNQDPLAPSDNTAMIAQMAQFSALEAMTNLGTAFSQTQAYTMIGKGIIGVIRGDGGVISQIGGRVDSAGVEGGRAYVMVGSAQIWADDILQVFDPNTISGDLTSILTGSNMVGKYVRANMGTSGKPEYIDGQVSRMVIEGNNVYIVINTGEGEEKVLLAQITEVSNDRLPALQTDGGGDNTGGDGTGGTGEGTNNDVNI